MFHSLHETRFVASKQQIVHRILAALSSLAMIHSLIFVIFEVQNIRGNVFFLSDLHIVNSKKGKHNREIKV